eukprot:TRINITY_DN19169_c0_g1_i1.p1 TRINITY_DN19169_c0_g1~~TRINITY_DN19169_c0_g1_i1.p1  ORF type:complete len:427 (-),score=66.75 TRINITY_DN19169_c0_g1_i1:19-1299(-)
MEGTADTFGALLEDFKERLPDTDYVAIDLEMTGVDCGEDSFTQSVEERYQRARRCAEQFTVCQVGITLARETGKSVVKLSTYNIFVFPHQRTFTCVGDGLRFLSKNSFDFNKWISSGVPFRNHQCVKNEVKAGSDTPSECGVQFSELWSLLCDAQKPVVMHSALLDLVFLFSSFEMSPLPDSGEGFVDAVRRLTPCLFDTAHLFTPIGAAKGEFARLGLAKFLEEVEKRVGTAVSFELDENTLRRYGTTGQAHEAGYDSFMTAKLFACLRAMAPETVAAESDRIYLWMSTECIDIVEGFNGRVAYYSQCVAFVASFEGENSKPKDHIGELRRTGSRGEVLTDRHALILWNISDSTSASIAASDNDGVLEAARKALPSASKWIRISIPPRWPPLHGQENRPEAASPLKRSAAGLMTEQPAGKQARNV